jgi:hypothetical protein
MQKPTYEPGCFQRESAETSKSRFGRCGLCGLLLKIKLASEAEVEPLLHGSGKNGRTRRNTAVTMPDALVIDLAPKYMLLLYNGAAHRRFSRWPNPGLTHVYGRLPSVIRPKWLRESGWGGMFNMRARVFLE